MKFFIEWEMFQTEVVKRIETYFMFDTPPPPKTVQFMRWCGKMWCNYAGHRWQNGAENILFAWRMTKTRIDTQYSILTDFQRQQWLHERVSVLFHLFHYLPCWGLCRKKETLDLRINGFARSSFGLPGLNECCTQSFVKSEWMVCILSFLRSM